MNTFYFRANPAEKRAEQAYRDEIQAEENLHQERKEEREMNANSNYPPGVTGSEPEIVGNDEWEKLHEGIDKDAADRNLTDVDVFVIWRLGLAAWEAAKKFKATFPHE